MNNDAIERQYYAEEIKKVWQGLTKGERAWAHLQMNPESLYTIRMAFRDTNSQDDDSIKDISEYFVPTGQKAEDILAMVRLRNGRQYSNVLGTLKSIQGEPIQEALIKNKNGQLVTNDIDALRTYAQSQPVSSGRALNLFVQWQSRQIMMAKLKGKNVRLYRASTSYGLKHCVENLSRALYRRGFLDSKEYCSNEEFIIAMLQNGFDCVNADTWQRKGQRYPGPNYYFNILPLPIRKPRVRNWNYSDEDYWIQQLMEDML